MMLYTVDQKDFEEWVNSPTTNISDLAEAVAIMRAKQSLLWMPGSIDSFHRDRYERDAVLTRRISACSERMRSLGHPMSL